MCVIVDMNVAARVFLKDGDPDFGNVKRAILSGKLPVVHGGQLTREYLEHWNVAQFVVELDRAGLSFRVPDQLVASEIDGIARNCISNDAHILALARASGARLLCSEDKKLHEDFGNSALIRPKGKVFQSNDHCHLLRKACDQCFTRK